MNYNEILKLLNENMVNKKIDFFVDESILNIILLDVSRVLDSEITNMINKYKKTENKKINNVEKEQIRKYFIGYPIIPDNFCEKTLKKYKPKINDEHYSEALKLIVEGFNRNKNVMINSLCARIIKNFVKDNKQLHNEYLKYIEESQRNYNQLIILEVKKCDKLTSDDIAEIIKNKYNSLSNYHYMIIVFDDNSNWKQISEVAVFMENFRSEFNFNLYSKNNKKRRIDELKKFLADNVNIDYDVELDKQIEKFYECVSYGFHFEDLFITQDGKNKILVMQKVELDEEPKKCPSCLESKVRGNSYSKVLYKSFECQNPYCPSRSKIGRGKRFDMLSAKRQIMLEKNSKNDHIDQKTYSAFRRDIIKSEDLSIERLIKLYSWSGDNVELINIETPLCNDNYKGRIISNINYKKFENDIKIDNIKIVELFKVVYKKINDNETDIREFENVNNSFVFNGNSSLLFSSAKNRFKEDFGGAVTSPPYYNAREYSQWDNLLCYLIDMMINSKRLKEVLKIDGAYIYNIGDIVSQDNIYIKSHMSKRRQMLGFLSVMIFLINGYELKGNIIWDKGEVQSKRNSTSNHISGYLKPVNSYEHCFIFKNSININENAKSITEVKRIETVKKINSKGQNILGHTAPYPEEIASLIIPFVKQNEYVLDPFLGSGTTIIAMEKEKFKAMGFELDNNYYNLAIQRIKENIL